MHYYQKIKAKKDEEISRLRSLITQERLFMLKMAGFTEEQPYDSFVHLAAPNDSVTFEMIHTCGGHFLQQMTNISNKLNQNV